MAVPTFTAQLGLPDPSAAPLTLTDLVNLLNALFLPISVNGFNAQIITGSATPGVSDQDKLWFRTDAGGHPLGFYVFNSGTWRPVYTGRPGEVKSFAGDPSPYFDGSGKGDIGLLWDGWALCNGQNGTVDLRDKFVAASAVWNGQWVTHVDNGPVLLSTGGAAAHILVQSDLPAYEPHFVGAEYDAGSSQSVNHFIIDNHWLNYGQGIFDPNAGQTDYGAVGIPQTVVPTLPPFFALAYVQFIGY